MGPASAAPVSIPVAFDHLEREEFQHQVVRYAAIHCKLYDPGTSRLAAHSCGTPRITPMDPTLGAAPLDGPRLPGRRLELQAQIHSAPPTVDEPPQAGVGGSG
jgi:hypothetical protein